MVDDILKFNNTFKLSVEEQKSIDGSAGFSRNCDPYYPYSHNGYSGCCGNPISNGEDPCDRSDCLIHVGQCEVNLS